jgi:hypothetical protein
MGFWQRSVFLTNAIKDTVSVLYWYEELSRNGNFWTGSSEPFFFAFFEGVYSPLGVGNRPLLQRLETKPKVLGNQWGLVL